MTPILAALWHRTRREFVAMTADDLSVKTKRHHDLIVADMRKMQADGSVIASSYSEKGKTIYELPPKMQAQVLAGVIQWPAPGSRRAAWRLWPAPRWR